MISRLVGSFASDCGRITGKSVMRSFPRHERGPASIPAGDHILIIRRPGAQLPSFHNNIKKAARKNQAFRQTVCMGAFSELVVISIPPMGELGEGLGYWAYYLL
jgi:hypothetical protein